MSEFDKKHYVCPACGKEFYVACEPDEWGYAYGAKLTCSYHCMRDMERADNARRKNNRERGAKFETGGALLFRQRQRGIEYSEIANTGTARTLGITSAKGAMMYLRRWADRNQYVAEVIRLDCWYEKNGISRQMLVDEFRVQSKIIREKASQIGISGRKCGRGIWYTVEEADRIRVAMMEGMAV